LLELRKATDQELIAGKEQEVVKLKGLALLTELDGAIQQIKSPQTRIKAQLQAAQLLWETDDKRAMKFMVDAMTGLKEFLTSVDANAPQFPNQYSTISQLRFEIVHILTPHDPDAALSFVQSTASQINAYGNQRETASQEAGLELWIANNIAPKDPERAMQMARRMLKNRYSSSLVGTISQLRMQRPELANQLANEIATKLIGDKLLKTNEAANLAIGLLRFGRPRRRSVLEGPDDPTARNLLLSEDQYRTLFQKILSEALAYSPPPPQVYSRERDAAWNMLTGLQQMGPELDTMMNGGVAAVEKKLLEMRGENQNSGVPSPIQNAIANAPVDAAIEAIGRAPEEQREQLYIQLATREANNGDLARARQIINDNVSNPYQRRNMLTNLDQQEIHRAASKGKVEDALRVISALRTPRERAIQLLQIANQLGTGQKRAGAIAVLEQARTLLAPSLQAQDQDQMNALFTLARAFSRYDTKRSFEILDPLIDQFNDICTAARTMEGFGPEYYEEEELNLQNGNSVSNIAGQMSNVLGTLATTNFERARAASDRLRLPEVRIRAYLEIAQQTINGASR
jgi:hypothetical protein